MYHPDQIPLQGAEMGYYYDPYMYPVAMEPAQIQYAPQEPAPFSYFAPQTPACSEVYQHADTMYETPTDYSQDSTDLQKMPVFPENYNHGFQIDFSGFDGVSQQVQDEFSVYPGTVYQPTISNENFRRQTVLCYGPKALETPAENHTNVNCSLAQDSNIPQKSPASPTLSESSSSTSSNLGNNLSNNLSGAKLDSGRLKCGQCNKSFTRHYSLKRHLLRFHALRKHRCPKCKKAYGHGTDLQKHTKTCIKGVIYQCPEVSCLKKLRSVEAFRRHLSFHDKTLCNFYDEYLGKQHRQLLDHAQGKIKLCRAANLDVPSFCCPLCQKTFIDLKMFQRHLLIHTSEKLRI